MMGKFLRYFFCTVAIGFIIFSGSRYELQLIEKGQMNYNFWPAVIFATVFPVLIGILLRLPKLITEIKRDKAWSVNWIKLLAVGLPTLYVALVPLLSFTILGKYLPFALEIFHLDLSNIAGLIFGYVMLDSIKED
ncbi:hypothetical protein [Bacillus sp. RO2]|uniref:hypothetical protein n=1 Tax=Bacillus sp. RO2 TaxID=2723913 RepID=UPI001F0EF64A|nr:hypothetical protein [Bacillus sp. RO2]